MQMADGEILRAYRQAEGKRAQKKKIRILAELNAVPVEEMQEYIDALESPADMAKEPKIKAAGQAKFEQDRKKVSTFVVEAVKLRMDEIGESIEANDREIKQLMEANEEYLEEWGVLAEFCKANE